MKKISLTRNQFAMVDDSDYEWLNQWKWCVLGTPWTNHFYAGRGIRISKGRRGVERMHRVILGLKRGDGKQVDHRDGNSLNNQRANLRICSRTQNAQNMRKRNGNKTSVYKGVCRYRRDSRWQARIKLRGKQKHLGCFTLERDAAQAYNEAALKHFGEFAQLNILDSETL